MHWSFCSLTANHRYVAANRKELENSAWVNTSAEAWRWLQAHPDNMQEYEEMQAWLEQRNKNTEQVGGIGWWGHGVEIQSGAL